MPGEVSPSFLQKLEKRREQMRASAELLLMHAKGDGRQRLNDDEEIEYRSLSSTIKDLSDRIAETRSEIQRCGSYPLGGTARTVGTAGRLAPLEFSDEQLQKLQGAAQRGETCRLEHRDFSTADSLLPSQLFPYPVERQHESRILDRLPGYAMETASITFVRHTGTSGQALPDRRGAA